MPACRRPVTFRTVRWRTLLTPPMDGPDNMALDVALMERARPTGGRAVLHHREVTYSVTAPAAGLGALRESYDVINDILVDALRALGGPARVARPAGAAPPPSVAPCFETPVAGEIVAGEGA